MKKPIELKISGMHCKSCEILTAEELSLLQGASDIKVSYKQQLAHLLLDDAKNNENDLIEAVKRAGYRAEIIKSDNKQPAANGHASPIILKLPEKGIKITINISPYSDNGINTDAINNVIETNNSYQLPFTSEIKSPAGKTYDTKSRISLSISGMHCSSCAGLIERSLKKVSGVTLANVNFAAEKAMVDFDSSKSK